MLRIYAGAAGLIALIAMWTWWLWQHDSKVVQQERVRVEAKGKVTDAKAQTARARAAAKPDGVLDRFYRD